MGEPKSEGASAPRRPARTQVQRRALAEARLLDAATSLIATRGIERFTLAEVGISAGYSIGLPAHYFGTKEGLIAAVAANIVEMFAGGLEQHVSEKEGLPGLLGLISYYFDSAAKTPIESRAIMVLRGEAYRYAGLERINARINRSGTAQLERQLHSAIDRNEIDQTLDVARQAILIQASMRGVLALWLGDPDAIALGPLRDAFLDNVCKALSAKRA